MKKKRDKKAAMKTIQFLIVLLLSLSVRGWAESARPNILFVFGDDWGRNASCYRDPARPSVNDVVNTPNIDRVAREGVLFRNAFVGVSSCTPSRASVVTGCYFWRCGKRAFLQADAGWEKNQVPEPGAALPGFGRLLQQAGYATSVAGKTLDGDWFPAKNIPLGGDRLTFSRYAEKNKLNRDQTAKVFEGVVRDVVQKILADRKPGQPFAHVLGPIGPHRPFPKGSGEKLWGIDPDALKGKLPPFIPDVTECRSDFADTLGEVLALDLEIGWLLDELEKAGELDNTMIVLTGDNGVCMPRGKTHCYDIAVHAPLMIRWPKGIARPGRVLEDFVNIMDLAPTWLEAARLQPPATMDGRSLMPLLKSEKSGQIDVQRDHVVVGRERHEATTRPDGMPYPMRAIRTADFLYIRNFKPDRWPSGDPYDADGPGGDPSWRDNYTVMWLVAHRDEPGVKPLYDLIYGKRPGEELYYLRRDPDQMCNVAGDPNYAATKAALSKKLMSVLEKTADPRLTDAFDKPPYVTGLGPAPGARKKKAAAKKQ